MDDRRCCQRVLHQVVLAAVTQLKQVGYESLMLTTDGDSIQALGSSGGRSFLDCHGKWMQDFIHFTSGSYSKYGDGSPDSYCGGKCGQNQCVNINIQAAWPPKGSPSEMQGDPYKYPNYKAHGKEGWDGKVGPLKRPLEKDDAESSDLVPEKKCKTEDKDKDVIEVKDNSDEAKQSSGEGNKVYGSACPIHEDDIKKEVEDPDFPASNKVNKSIPCGKSMQKKIGPGSTPVKKHCGKLCNHIPGSAEKGFKCRICKFKFSSEDSLHGHITARHFHPRGRDACRGQCSRRSSLDGASSPERESSYFRRSSSQERSHNVQRTSSMERMHSCGRATSEERPHHCCPKRSHSLQPEFCRPQDGLGCGGKQTSDERGKLCGRHSSESCYASRERSLSGNKSDRSFGTSPRQVTNISSSAPKNRESGGLSKERTAHCSESCPQDSADGSKTGSLEISDSNLESSSGRPPGDESSLNSQISKENSSGAQSNGRNSMETDICPDKGEQDGTEVNKEGSISCALGNKQKQCIAGGQESVGNGDRTMGDCDGTCSETSSKNLHKMLLGKHGKPIQGSPRVHLERLTWIEGGTSGERVHVQELLHTKEKRDHKHHKVPKSGAANAEKKKKKEGSVPANAAKPQLQPDKMLKCPTCSKVFSRESSLIAHMGTHKE